MITNDGIEIISKYLVGQASSYASYIAIGSGSRPTSNNSPLTLTSTGTATLGDYDGTPPYEATITLSAGYWGYIQVGDRITAGNNTGSLGSGTVTVTGIINAQKIAITSTNSMTAGTLGSIRAYSVPNSNSFSSKTNLDFEVARFPITSRSYVVEKQTVKPNQLYISAAQEVTVDVSTGHTFSAGEVVQISGIDTTVQGNEVNGLYRITSTTETSFIADVYDKSSAPEWDSSLWGISYFGYYYNQDLFTATSFVKQISLSAEMLDTARYDVSELGIYSLGSNQYSASGDSRMLFTFAQTEGWQHYNNSTNNLEDISTLAPIELPIGTAPKFCSSSDGHWNNFYGKQRNEKPRILDDGLILPGALSSWNGTTDFDSTSDYILLTEPGINLAKSSGNDEVRLAYSIMNAVNLPTALPTNLYIRIRFVCSNGTDTADLDFFESGTTVINPNRYAILTKKLSEITATSGFDWSTVTSARVYCAIENAAGNASDDYAVVLDGLRFENLGTENPLYALTAYTVVNNETATNIVKSSNSNDLINFRLDFAVGN